MNEIKISIEYENDIPEKQKMAEERTIPQDYSGYYMISAKYTTGDLPANIFYHRGEGLPSLENGEGIKELLFTDAAIEQINKDTQKGFLSHPMGMLDDIFTKEEVAMVIKDNKQYMMNISIDPLTVNSICENAGSISEYGYGSIKPGNFSRWEPNYTDKYVLSVEWLEPDGTNPNLSPSSIDTVPLPF